MDGLRVVLLRRPRIEPARVRSGLFFALLPAWLLVEVGIAAVDLGSPPWQLEPHGIVTLLASALLVLSAAWLLAAMARRSDAGWGIAALLVAATIASTILVQAPARRLALAVATRGYLELSIWLFGAAAAWWLVMLAIYARRLMPRRPARALLAAVLAWLVSAAPWIWLPADPPLIAVGDGIAVVDGPPAEAPAEQPPHAIDPEQVMFDQRALLDARLAALRAQTPGQPDLYVVAFAGDAQEAVFGNEAAYVEQLFSMRFGAEGRVLVLQNDPQTTARRPLATWTNLHYALQAVARLMDPGEDVLLVYLTSHGTEEHELLVDLPPLPLDQIAPPDLAEALATEPAMPARVVIVNACYSGGFIDALRGDASLVITSASADRPSFGCGAEADITWFGRAFLVDALNRTTSIHDAFALARSQVAEWERAEGEEPSGPQIATTPAIEARLERWRATLPADAPVVPFSIEGPRQPPQSNRDAVPRAS
jgi:hypothetical protein